MSSLPVVSIVGRPNVGKSSLFNRILGRKAAVVDDASGVTRDRNYMDAFWGDCRFTLVDTGGLEPTSRESIVSEIHTQVNIAIEESSVIVFMVENGTGTTDLDMLISRDLLKRGGDNVILAVNKSESESARYEAATFTSLGLGEPMPISALHGQGIGDLLDKVRATIESRDETATEPTGPTEDLCIAVIGRPNAGKSSFVNCVLKQKRMIVDSKPGTTRDAIDTVFNYKKRSIRLIDTAGLRRKSQVKANLEYYSNLRALSSMRRADVCLLIIDTTVEMASQDFKILAQLKEMKRGLVVCFNKWDIMDKDHKTYDNLVSELRKNYMELRHAPFVSTSALTGQRVNAALDAALTVRDRMENIVQPAKLRQAIFEWVRAHPHPYASNKDVRFLGVRQRKGTVPSFEFFCTNPDAIVSSYERYLTNKIYDAYDFDGCPILLTFKKPGRTHSKPKVYTPDMGDGY